MHLNDDPMSNMQAKNYLNICCLMPLPSKFGLVFWSRLLRRGPVEYNYPYSCLSGRGVMNLSKLFNCILIM